MRAVRMGLALIAILPAAVAAQSPTDSTVSRAKRLPTTVVVAARRAQPLEEVAGTVSVIVRPEIARLQAQDIRDLVRLEPGVSVVADAARFGLDGFNIRGVQGNRVAVRIDGVPLPDGFAVGSFSNAGRDQVEPEWLERVEILRGPASALYGSDALGGVVSMRTLEAQDLLRDASRALTLHSGFSGRDQARRLAALGAWQHDGQGLLLGLAERRGHELMNNAGALAPAANPADSARSSLMGKWSRRFDAAQAGLSVERYRQQVDTDVRSLVNGPGQFSTTQALRANDLDVRERMLASLRLDHPLRGLDEVELSVYRQGNRTEQHTEQRRRAAPPALRAPTLRERDFTLEQAQYGLQLVGRSMGSGRRLAQNWVYGLELSQTRVNESRDGVEVNLDTGARSNVILGERLPVRDFPNSVLRRGALFATGEITWSDTSWALLPALRYDRFTVDARRDVLFAEDNPGRAVVDTQDQRVTPKLGLRRALGDSGSLYAAWTEGFRAPPFSDVNIALVLPQFNYVVLPNPDLKPERSRGFEVGASHESAAWSAHLVAFHNRYRNLIESRANLGTNADGATVFQSVNRAQARIRGFEGSARMDLGAFAPALVPWSVRAAFAYAHGEDTARGRPLNSVQPPRWVLGVVRDASHGWPEIALDATAVSAVRRIDRSTADLFAPPGYVNWDLRLRKQFGSKRILDLAIYNVTDHRHWDWAALRGVTRTAQPTPAFYSAPGRSVALTLTLGW